MASFVCKENTRVTIVLDGSSSINAEYKNKKKVLLEEDHFLKELVFVKELVEKFPSTTEVAIVTFGYPYSVDQHCFVETVQDFMPKQQILTKVLKIAFPAVTTCSADKKNDDILQISDRNQETWSGEKSEFKKKMNAGLTPLGSALKHVNKLLQHQDTDKDHTVIMLTDGKAWPGSAKFVKKIRKSLKNSPLVEKIINEATILKEAAADLRNIKNMNVDLFAVGFSGVVKRTLETIVGKKYIPTHILQATNIKELSAPDVMKMVCTYTPKPICIVNPHTTLTFVLDGSYSIEQYKGSHAGCGNFYKELEFVRNITTDVSAGSYSVITLGYNKDNTVYKGDTGVMTLIEDADQKHVTKSVMDISYPAVLKCSNEKDCEKNHFNNPEYLKNYCKRDGDENTSPVYTKKKYNNLFMKGGQTQLGSAVLKVIEILQKKTTTDNVVVFITDGRPYPSSEAKLFKENYARLKNMVDRNDKVEVYAIGVGLKRNDKVLDQIASNNDHKIAVNNMKDLSGLVSSMSKKVCMQFAAVVSCNDQIWRDTCSQACAEHPNVSGDFDIECRDSMTGKPKPQKCSCGSMKVSESSLRGAR